MRIEDVNDNYPLFPGLRLINPNYGMFKEDPIFELFTIVEENLKFLTKIALIKAVDVDKQRNITYKIVHSTDNSGLLAVDSTSGELTVRGKIDFEKIHWINLTIVAFDNGMPYHKHSLLFFHCRIEDLNDNAPSFVKLKTTEFELYENVSVGTSISQFSALDPDSGELGRVEYLILSGDERKFAIDSTSVISSK